MTTLLRILIALSFFLIISCSHQPPADNIPVVNAAGPKKTYIKPAPSQISLFNIPYRNLDLTRTIQSFGFGSCNDQKLEQPLWKNISKAAPDLFIMMGDNVYSAKTEDRPIINQYIKLNSNSDYKNLRENVPFLATWDDNDYGQRDGGIDNPEKHVARSVFLNYWGYLRPTLPKNQQALYHSRIAGSKKERVQFILLDTRWDRTALKKNPVTDEKTSSGLPKEYVPEESENARLLSDEQWKWLKSELQKPAELRFIVSSIQVIANDHPFEKWGNFPKERERFFKLLKDLKLKNVILLSGDRHQASIAKFNLSDSETKPQFLYEVTSSSLNKKSPSENPENDVNYIAPSFLNINYGLAKIDWRKREVSVDILDEKDQAQLSQKIKF